jgi:hypothetical protein
VSDPIEARLHRLEDQVDEITRNIAGLHNSSMAYVTETFAQMERRIMDAAEANTRRVEAQIALLGERTASLEVRAGLIGLIGGALPSVGVLAGAWLTGHLH